MTRRDLIRDKIYSQILLTEEGCWMWTGTDSGNGRGGGYPRMCLNGHTVAVHRVMFTNEHGYIPGRKEIDHTCRNRMCVNPGHLELVTHKENCKRRDKAKFDK